VTDRTVRLLIAYDGTDFRGWAAQRDASVRTVEGLIAGQLQSVVGGRPRLKVAGRTDAGVHARGQVASFITPSGVPPASIQAALNGALAPEVVVRDARYAPDGFDARMSATAREYVYRIDIGDVTDPFRGRFVWHRPGDLMLRAMRMAASPLLGEHDFASFCRHPGPGRSTTRRLERAAIRREGEVIELTFRANAFLHQMVRSLVATLVAVGEGRLAPSDVAPMLAARDRAASRGRLAPSRGLTLERVVYGRGRRA
jgi:tRNA pseudouridine38-40 synthase